MLHFNQTFDTFNTNDKVRLTVFEWWTRDSQDTYTSGNVQC